MNFKNFVIGFVQRQQRGKERFKESLYTHVNLQNKLAFFFRIHYFNDKFLSLSLLVNHCSLKETLLNIRKTCWHEINTNAWECI